MFRFVALSIFVLALAASAPANAQRRVALVIGIDAYAHLSKLKKAVNDARAVAQVLRDDLAFDTVLTGENLARSQMVRKLAELDGAILPGDTVLFFFSGHGVALSTSENILLPADIAKPGLGQEGLVRDDGFPVDGIIRRIQQRGALVSLMILDACRDNPFEQAGVRSIGATRGLARIEAPQGVFVLFSAGLGQKALDRLPGTDPAQTSVFTRHLLPALTSPGLSHVQIAKRVQQEVSTAAARVSHAQQPAYYDQIVGDVVLRGSLTSAATSSASSPVVPPSTPPSIAPPKAADTAAEARYAWGSAQLSMNRAEIEAFRRQFGAGNPFYDQQAAARLAMLDEIDRKERERLAQQAAAARAEAERIAAEKRQAEEEARRIAALNRDAGKVFRDCADCPEMVIVPAGSFMMGSPENEEGRAADEGPRRTVTIRQPFAVGKFEVTFAEWEACVAGGGCAGNRASSYSSWGQARRPIDVSWDDAKQYVAWLSSKTGKTYRLLTEAEWEYAARAGTATPFSTGRTITTKQANFDGNHTYGGNAKGEQRRRTVEVGTFPPNSFGLHDMHGNAWEWVEDCRHDSYNGAPSDGSAWTSACADGIAPVVRGGSWEDGPQNLRSASRGEIATVYRRLARIFSFGFRVARTLTP